MNKFHRKLLLIILGLLLLIGLLIIVNVKNSQEVKDENSQKANILYQKGIDFGAIDPAEVSKKDWEEQEKMYRENYDTAIREGILKDISYEKWLEDNNYGQFPKVDPEIFDEFIIPPASER